MNKIFRSALCFSLCITLLFVSGVSLFAAPDHGLVFDKNSPLRGVSVGFYGDSISAANADGGTSYDTVRGWAGRVGYSNGMKWKNHSVSAYSVSNCRGERTIYSQLIATIDRDYDMIILHGGTNDAWDNAPVGKMTEGFGASDSYNVSTFAGGLEQLFALIKERNPDAIVGYIINFKFINATKGQIYSYWDENKNKVTDYRLKHMDDYVEMTKKICDKWGVAYLDLFSDDELTATLHPTRTDSNGKVTYLNTYLSDFIHPTPAGYNVIYPYVEEFMLELVAPKVEETTPSEDAQTTPPTPTTEPSEKEGGCRSFGVGSVALVSLVALAGATVVSGKKRIDETNV